MTRYAIRIIRSSQITKTKRLEKLAQLADRIAGEKLGHHTKAWLRHNGYAWLYQAKQLLGVGPKAIDAYLAQYGLERVETLMRSKRL